MADGTRILHVGPPKTATTSIQAAFHASRKELAKHSVVYAGRTRHSRAPATAIAMEKLGVEFSRAALEQWDVLAQEIRESDARVTVLSSEGLSYANVERGRRIVDQIGGAAHVVITMRPAARMVPSVWQQRVRRGSDQPLDAWLEQVFDRDAAGEFTATHYWGRFGLDRLVATWSDVVGAENVTVVVLDPSDHDLAYRAFEDLVGVPSGTLSHVASLANESFPFAELETIRQFNELFYAAGGTRKEWLETIRKRGFGEFRQPGSPQLTGAKADVPRWVAEQANDVASGWIEALRTFEGRLIGDPAHLLVDPSRYPETTAPPETVPISSAGLLAHIMFDAARRRGQAPSARTAKKAAKAAGAPASPSPAAGSPVRARAAGARRRLVRAWAALRGA
ncbi:MAG: hypothetical protein GX593_14820 [Actinomycetales bacterium]|nr:hypothetical protein [Actinomycetales bacterium]